MHGHLWVVRAGLDAQVAAAAGFVEVVARELRQVGQGFGAVVREVELPEEGRAEADRERQAGGFEAQGLARVVGGRLGQAAVGTLAHRVSGRHPPGGLRPVLQQLDELRAVVGRHVERGEVQAVLYRGGDARLVRAVEGDRGSGVCRGFVVAAGHRDRSAGRGGAER